MSRRVIPYLVGLPLLAGGCWLMVGMLFGFQGLRQIALSAACCLVAVALFWVVRRLGHRSYRVWLTAGLLTLVFLFLPASLLLRLFPGESADLFAGSVLLVLFVVLSGTLLLSAALFLAGLALYQSAENEDAGPQLVSPYSSKQGVLLLVLGLLLLVKVLHSLYQVTLWDNTHDALGYICLGGPILAVFCAGFLLVMLLPGRAKVGGFLYLLALPLLLFVVSTLGQRVSIFQLTEDRAARVNGAIAAYYVDNGHYPQDLQQLSPRYIFSLSEPGIIFGQEWCFESSADGYTLGYVTRDHWSDPRLYARVHASENRDDSEAEAVCSEAIEALEARAPQYYDRLAVE